MCLTPEEERTPPKLRAMLGAGAQHKPVSVPTLLTGSICNLCLCAHMRATRLSFLPAASWTLASCQVIIKCVQWNLGPQHLV